MIQFLFTFVLSQTAHAIVMEPTFQAAESMGYQIVGEIEFRKESFKIPAPQIEKQIRELGEMCPRTQAVDAKISSSTRFVILAWSDLEYPSRERAFHPVHQQWLAHKRGLAVAEKIRGGARGNLNFELVNMATRKAHMVEDVTPERAGVSRFNVKETLELAGAAPSHALGLGLFAEYSQAAKAVIWVECNESPNRRRGPLPQLTQLAALGQVQ